MENMLINFFDEKSRDGSGMVVKLGDLGQGVSIMLKLAGAEADTQQLFHHPKADARLLHIVVQKSTLESHLAIQRIYGRGA